MKLKKNISVAVFWGAAWGTLEATLGSLLHAANFSVGWLIWFPIAFYFMNKVYRQTGKCESILLLSAVAAAVKLIDLFLPVRVDKVINPAASILLEGLVVFITFKMQEKYSNPSKYKILEVAVISFLWRILYAAYILFMPSWMAAISPIRGVTPFLKFLLLESTANTLTVLIIIKLYERIHKFNKNREAFPGQLPAKTKHLEFFKEIHYFPLSALALLIVAILIQWVL